MTTDAVGGVWRYSMAMAAGLAARGWQCTMATMGPSPGSAQRSEAAAIAGCTLLDTGLPLDWVAPDKDAIANAATTLDHLAGCSGADTVHLHTPGLAAFPWCVPVVAVAHSCVGTWWHAMHETQPPPDIRWRMALVSQGIDRAAATIAPSHAVAAALRAVYATLQPISIVYNGLDPCAVTISRRERRVLAAGRLWDRGKNLAVLDSAASMVDAPIEAAGPSAGPDGERFVASGITLLGTLSPALLRGAMQRAAVFASPSLYEPFGLAVLEAAQLATPLVLADNPTFRELWGGAAAFVDPRDPRAWAERLRAMLDSPNDQRIMGKRALDQSRCYTATKMVEATMRIHRASARELA